MKINKQEIMTNCGIDLANASEVEKATKIIDAVAGAAMDVVKKRFMGDLNREDMEAVRCANDVAAAFDLPTPFEHQAS